ncbi:hypothetical protein [Nitrosopumilus sp.]|uniref:hypothetical protein n=1 Tax=Nitrosopumilus sp. TaxID=2024843 RepID=UPI00247E3028|nr:hypothetical protein [Nitrosopumilus sp.]MCV0410767.1 hypothetical protein [Nitrosopumilus sp.]
MTRENSKPIISKVKGKVGTKLYVESVLVDNKPAFIVKNLSTEKIEIKYTIEQDCCTLRPLTKGECGYIPYSYDRKILDELISSEITTEEALDEILKQIDKFIDLPKREKILILGDILLTYSLEWVSTLHYPFFVGDNESGKSSVLHLGRYLNYRCMMSEDLPHANIYNFLGEDEEATGTICEDEAQFLDKDGDKIRTYKSSYSSGSSKPRVVTLQSRKFQVYYKTYCAKWFAGEKLPRDKGFMERLAIVNMVKGNPKSNIKRLKSREISQLQKLRNMLLIWKIQRVGKNQDSFKTDLTGRNQELWEDFLSVFQNTKFYGQAENVVKHYVNQRHDSIKNSLEATIFKILIENINEKKEIESKAFWIILTTDNIHLPGRLDTWSSRKFYPDEFDVTLSPNSLSNLLEDKFQGTKMSRVKTVDGKQRKTTVYCFDEKTIETLKTKYNI